jgi:hypothetical protein
MEICEMFVECFKHNPIATLILSFFAMTFIACVVSDICDAIKAFANRPAKPSNPSNPKEKAK